MNKSYKSLGEFLLYIFEYTLFFALIRLLISMCLNFVNLDIVFGSVNIIVDFVIEILFVGCIWIFAVKRAFNSKYVNNKMKAIIAICVIIYTSVLLIPFSIKYLNKSTEVLYREDFCTLIDEDAKIKNLKEEYGENIVYEIKDNYDANYKGIVQCGREHTLIVKKPMHVGELVLLISFDIAILCVALFLSFRQLKISGLRNEKEI